MNSEQEARIGAIVLVGGRSSRMGGGSKPLFDVGGRTLFARAVSALAEAACVPIIAVGPVLDAGAPVQWVREEPPFAGPVAAISAALDADGSGNTVWMLLLAGDLPHAELIVQTLVAQVAVSGDDRSDAQVFSADGYPQWLAGIYRTAALRSALTALGDVTDASCRALLGGLAISWIADDGGITADIDTPADLARIRAELEEEP